MIILDKIYLYIYNCNYVIPFRWSIDDNRARHQVTDRGITSIGG